MSLVTEMEKMKKFGTKLIIHQQLINFKICKIKYETIFDRYQDLKNIYP